MRILYIYKDYFQRRKLYGKIMKQLGHEVVFLEKKHKQVKNQITIDEVKKSRADLIWLQSPWYVKYNPIAMEYISSKKIPMIFYHTVSGRFPYSDWLDVWKQFAIIFPAPYDLHKYLIENGINSHYMPFAFHPSQYFKSISTKKHNISFAGTVASDANPKRDDRCRYLNSLKDFKKVVAFGKSFRGKLHKNISIRGCKTHQDQRKVYGKTKINLSLPFFSGGCSFYKNQYHFKNRFFEIPATCNFMLGMRTKEFVNIFPEDTVGYYDNSIESFRESVKRYLKDDKIRQKMAEKSYKLAHQKHTYLHRFKAMFKIIES